MLLHDVVDSFLPLACSVEPENLREQCVNKCPCGLPFGKPIFQLPPRTRNWFGPFHLPRHRVPAPLRAAYVMRDMFRAVAYMHNANVACSFYDVSALCLSARCTTEFDRGVFQVAQIVMVLVNQTSHFLVTWCTANLGDPCGRACM